MKLFKSNLTKWIPLGEYTFSTRQSVVLVRGNTKTGELFFKTKKVSGDLSHPIGSLGINVQEQWKKIIGILNS